MGIPVAGTNKVRNMHYDFKQKLNKIDSQQYRNLRVPEIDWKLNEAENILIQSIVHPKLFQGLGLELNQRSTDEIRTLMVDNLHLKASSLGADSELFTVNLPIDYFTYMSAYANLTKGTCRAKVRITLVQHDDETEESPFDKSSFEWREVNARFHNNQLMILTDNTFTIDSVELNYVRKSKYFHTAVDAVGNAYNLPDGTVLTGYQNCELPEILHREIVDLAVLITTGDLSASLQAKQMKLQLTN